MIVALILIFIGMLALCFVAANSEQAKPHTMIKLHYYLGDDFLFYTHANFVPAVGNKIDTPEHHYTVTDVMVMHTEELPIVGKATRNVTEVRIYIE